MVCGGSWVRTMWTADELYDLAERRVEGRVRGREDGVPVLVLVVLVLAPVPRRGGGDGRGCEVEERGVPPYDS